MCNVNAVPEEISIFLIMSHLTLEIVFLFTNIIFLDVVLANATFV